MDIVLIGGLWLPPRVWQGVETELARLGHRPVAVTLPGQGDGASGATLADQIDAVLAAVDSAAGPALVVGHSAASSLAWIAADRRPVAGVVLIGGFPVADGEPYADFFPVVDGAMPFPGWQAFDGPDAVDLDPAARERLASVMIPTPEGVARGVVQLTDERRYGVPVTLVCPEFGPDDVRSWIAAGDLPELARVRDLRLVDIDSGHWPMVTQPVRLAAQLAQATESASPRS